MRFHSILAKVATGLFLVVEMTAASAAVTFNINQTVGAGSVVGQVMTDGAIGTVLAPKVLDWNLIVNDGVTSLNLLGPLSGANSAFGGGFKPLRDGDPIIV